MNTDIKTITDGISEVIVHWEPILAGLDKDTITRHRNHQDRTVKQLIGHLIDSASNNHQRMVRLQYNEMLVFPDYTQDNDRWIGLQDYRNADWDDLRMLWKYYNLHIIRVMESVDLTTLENHWHDFDGNKITLRDMMEGYLWHLRLHMDEVGQLISK